jgi:hypothetical protein
MDLERAQKIRREFPALNTGQKRHLILSLHTEHMNIDYHRVEDYWPFQDREEAIEEIVKALRERNRRITETCETHNLPIPKDWTDDEFYENAKGCCDNCYDIMRAYRPRVLQLYLELILSSMVRKRNTKVVVNNESPKTRRGRKKTKHLTVVNGGWDGEYNDEIPWLAEDLFIKEKA